MEPLASTKNPRIKAVCELQEKSRERRKQGLFVVEGLREITLAIDAGYIVDTLFYCAGIAVAQQFVARPGLPISATPVTAEVFEKIAYREHSDGLLGVFRARPHSLAELCVSDNPFIIVVEAVEKPGNLGAILRTADAAKADAIIVCDPLTDIYNPNVIRSGIGCVFTQQIAVAASADAVAWLRSRNIALYAAALTAAEWYHQVDFTQPAAVVMGTEADGLSPYWLQQADACIKIPMRGQIDSLNVSVATAVITFEAMRQRNFR